MMMFLNYAPPLAVHQGTVCSAFVEGSGRCKHGFPQSHACAPYKRTNTLWSREGWAHVERGPVCTWDEIPERFASTGGEKS